MPPLACVEAPAWLFSSGRAAEGRQPVSVFRIIHRSLSASPGARALSLAARMRAPSEEKASPPPTTAGMGWSPLPDMVGGMGGAEVHAQVDFKIFVMTRGRRRGAVRHPRKGSSSLYLAWGAPLPAGSRGVSRSPVPKIYYYIKKTQRTWDPAGSHREPHPGGLRGTPRGSVLRVRSLGGRGGGPSASGQHNCCGRGGPQPGAARETCQTLVAAVRTPGHFFHAAAPTSFVALAVD